MPTSQTVRRSVAMTPDMRARLQQLVLQEPGDITEADLIRQAIREYLDRQEDLIGSRAHFRKTFQTRIDDLQTDLDFQMGVVLALLAHGLSIMLPVFTEQPVTAAELVREAVAAAESVRALVAEARQP